MTETTTAAPVTCTVVVDGTSGRCGAEAVFVLPGGRFTECAEHFAGEIAPRRTALAAGDRVRLTHVGVEKVGTVVGATAISVRVLVPVFAGTRRESTKVVTVSADAVDEVPAAVDMRRLYPSGLVT